MLIHYESQFNERISQLLLHSSFHLIWGEESEMTFLTVDKDEVVGIGSLWKKSIHPYRDYIGIYVKPNYRNKGIGQALYDSLSLNSEIKKFQISIQSTNESASSFLKKQGFKLARKCYTPVLKEFKSTELGSSSVEGEIISYGMVSKFNQNDAVELQLKNYIDFHQSINPLQEEITMDQWKEIVLRDLNTEHSKLLLADGTIVAYLFCYDTDNEEEIEIGYIGGKDIDTIENYLSFYKGAVEQLLSHYALVSIEADDVDPYAFTVLNCFKYDADKSLDAYIL